MTPEEKLTRMKNRLNLLRKHVDKANADIEVLAKGQEALTGALCSLSSDVQIMKGCIVGLLILIIIILMGIYGQ